MKTILYLLPLCSLLQLSPFSPGATRQAKTVTEKNFFRFGDQLVTIEKYGNEASKDYVLLCLHSNEHRAIRSSLEFARASDAYLVRLLNSDRRKIEGFFLDQRISFDPNNIFTDWGRKEHLKDNDCWTKYLDVRVEQFSEFLLNELPAGKTIVSLHTHKQHTIRDFMEKKKLRRQVKQIHRNPALNISDYFITTDESIYGKLEMKDMNVILLHPKKIFNNGSLAVRCAREKRPFVHVEVREAAVEMQQEMLMVLDEVMN